MLIVFILVTDEEGYLTLLAAVPVLIVSNSSILQALFFAILVCQFIEHVR